MAYTACIHVFRCVTREVVGNLTQCFVHGITAFLSLKKTHVCDPMEKWLDSFYGLTVLVHGIYEQSSSFLHLFVAIS